LVAHLGEEMGVELALGGEVLVQDRLGHSGGFGDVAHRGDVEALLREDAERYLEELTTTSCGRQPCGHDAPISVVLPNGNRSRAYVTVTPAALRGAIATERANRAVYRPRADRSRSSRSAARTP
jgi:hypothetical protein